MGTNTKFSTTALFKSLFLFFFRFRTGILVSQNPNVMKKTRLLFASLLFTLPLFFSNCTKDNNIPATTQETLIRSNWGVDYYFNGQNLTSNYNSYQLLFSNTGLLVAQKNNVSVSGNWSGSLDANNNEVYSISFNTTDADLLQLNGPWKLTTKSAATIEFEKNENGNVQEVFRIRKD